MLTRTENVSGVLDLRKPPPFAFFAPERGGGFLINYFRPPAGPKIDQNLMFFGSFLAPQAKILAPAGRLTRGNTFLNHF